MIVWELPPLGQQVAQNLFLAASILAWLVLLTGLIVSIWWGVVTLIELLS
jgi:hypothetical protein